MAESIKADGPPQADTQVQPQDGKTFTLQELQAAVGGYIEIVGLPNGRFMVLNEEGKRPGLEVNAAATRLARSRIGADDYPPEADGRRAGVHRPGAGGVGGAYAGRPGHRADHPVDQG